jgi:NADH:ubiquinone oxidoreductase subunit D
MGWAIAPACRSVAFCTGDDVADTPCTELAFVCNVESLVGVETPTVVSVTGVEEFAGG